MRASALLPWFCVDWAGQFTEAFDAVLAGAGIEVAKIPSQPAGERSC
jgi:hypothetical protein